jgi:hypothetical protein
MELLPHQKRDTDERSDVVRLGCERHVPASVGELTDRQLDLQRRLVRESLLLRPV